MVLISVLAVACGDEFTTRPDDDPPLSATASGAGGSSGGPGSGGSGASSASTGGRPSELNHEVEVVDQTGSGVDGVPIVVHDGDGKVVATTETGPDGKVVVEVPEAGALASFWQRPDGERNVSSVHQPPLGAPIRFRIETPETRLTTEYQVTVTYNPAFTEEVHLHSSCGTFQTSALGTIELDNNGCTHETDPDFLFVASNSSDVPLGWAAFDDIGVDPGGTIIRDVAVDRTDLVQAQLKLVDAPVDAAYGAIMATAHFGDAEFGMTHGVTAPSNNVPTVAATLPSGAQLTHMATSLLTWSVNSAEGSNTIRTEPITNWQPAMAYDASTLPRTTVSAPDVADPTHPSLAWQATPIADADALSVEFRWTEGEATHVWRAQVPPDATTLVLGDVPDALADFRPGASWTRVSVAQAAIEGVDGYADSLASSVDVTKTGSQIAAGFIQPP
ncbi:MAG: hypothetical protein WKG00_18770 [Polyangiaceae bacterium]